MNQHSNCTEEYFVLLLTLYYSEYLVELISFWSQKNAAVVEQLELYSRPADDPVPETIPGPEMISINDTAKN